MKINQAAEIIIRDLCGYNDSLFAEAYLCAAYATEQELKDAGLVLDTETMRRTISSIISRQADVTQSLVNARLQSPGEAKQLALINGFDLIPVIHSACSLCETPINSVGAALAVINTDPDAPKFGEAVDWVIASGHDVPEEVRAEMIKNVDYALNDLGVKPQKGKHGEIYYESNEIAKAIASNTLH